METFPVVSSNVAEVSYDEALQCVYVRFLNNSLYRYDSVPKTIFDELVSSPSVGSYLNRNFKNVYPYERVE